MAFMRDPLYILMQDGQVRMYDTKFGGFHLSQELFDEIVMMRFYNMTTNERREAIDRVIETQFETGANGLRKASGLSTVMERAEAWVRLEQIAKGR